MNEIGDMFERQAAWQSSRASLSWTEKLRLAARLRDAALAMRGTVPVKRNGRADRSVRLEHPESRSTNSR